MTKDLQGAATTNECNLPETVGGAVADRPRARTAEHYTLAISGWTLIASN